MHFNRSDWFTLSRLSAHIPYFDLIWRVIALSVGKLKNFLRTNWQKKDDFASFLQKKTQEMLENAILAAY